MDINSIIDTGIELFQHEFFMVIGGLAFFFAIKMSWETKSKDILKKEFRAAAIGGLVFLIWDDETLEAVKWGLTIGGVMEESDPPIELHGFFYLVVSPVIDRINWLLKKFKK